MARHEHDGRAALRGQPPGEGRIVRAGASAPPPPAFAPSDLANLINWSRKNTGLFQEAALSTAANVSDPVGGWDDQSPAGNNMTTAIAGNRPIRDADGINFDAAGDFLASPGALLLKPATFFCKFDMAGVSGNQRLLGSLAAGLSVDLNGSDLRLLKQAVALIGTATAPVPASGVVYTIVTYGAAGQFTFHLNGAAAGSGTNDQTIDSAVAEMGSSLGAFFGGKMIEWGLYSDVKSGADLASLNTYLAAL